MQLNDYLRDATKNNKVFSIQELKSMFKKDKELIERYVFLGLIERVGMHSKVYRARIF